MALIGSFCDHTGHPAWAQNDAMMGAYMDDMAYYYRVNDDTVLETGSWTEKMIEQLLRSEPANVGVAGPWFKEGPTGVQTSSFTLLEVSKNVLNVFFLQETLQL